MWSTNTCTESTVPGMVTQQCKSRERDNVHGFETWRKPRLWYSTQLKQHTTQMLIFWNTKLSLTAFESNLLKRDSHRNKCGSGNASDVPVGLVNSKFMETVSTRLLLNL